MTDHTWHNTMAHNMRRLLLIVALALVVLQTLGVWHRVLHFAHGAPPQQTAAQTSSPLSALWGEHSKTSDCQSFDHAIPDGLQTVSLTPQAMPAPAVWWGVVFQERFALAERFFSCRGPPVVLM